MKRRLFTAFIVLTAAVPSIFAQRPHTAPSPAQMVANKVARLTTLLGLSSAQAAEATTLFTTEETSLTGISANMKTARTALQTAIKANDAANISSLSAQIGSLTGQEVLAQSTASAGFWALLTAEQQTKYSQLGGGAGGGRGGGFGPGARRGAF